MIVPVNNNGGHNYPVNEPTLKLGVEHWGLRIDGMIGNNLSAEKKDNRPATEAEIDKFFEFLSKI